MKTVLSGKQSRWDALLTDASETWKSPDSRRLAEQQKAELRGERKETQRALDGTRELANRKLKTTFLCGVYIAANREKNEWKL